MTRPRTRTLSLHVYVVKIELNCIVNSCTAEIALQIVWCAIARARPKMLSIKVALQRKREKNYYVHALFIVIEN